MKFGIFYEHQLPASVDRRHRARADPERARAGRARGQARHPVRVGGRAPLPRGVLALLRARDLPRRGAASARKNIRLGHGIIQTAPNYNHPARTAERVATLDLVSNGRVDFGSGESSIARPSSAASRSIRSIKREHVARGARGRDPVHDRDAVHRRRRQVRPDAAAQRRAEAGAEAAPAAVGRVLAPRDDPAGGREGHRRARRSRSSTPKRPRTGCNDYESTLAEKGVAGRQGRQRRRSRA